MGMCYTDLKRVHHFGRIQPPPEKTHLRDEQVRVGHDRSPVHAQLCRLVLSLAHGCQGVACQGPANAGARPVNFWRMRVAVPETSLWMNDATSKGDCDELLARKTRAQFWRVHLGLCSPLLMKESCTSPIRSKRSCKSPSRPCESVCVYLGLAPTCPSRDHHEIRILFVWRRASSALCHLD